jgi:hypothetical protein
MTKLTVSQVAARLGVSRARIHQLDVELTPRRCACGARIYDPSAVAAYEQRRAAAREALSAARSERMRAMRDEFHPQRPRTWRSHWR